MNGVWLLADERVNYKRSSSSMTYGLRQAVLSPRVLQIWEDFERRGLSQQDASYLGVHPTGAEIQFYRVKVHKAVVPKTWARQTGVSLKVGWGFMGRNFHPGKWDCDSWSISGSGSSCYDGNYQRPWLFQSDRTSFQKSRFFFCSWRPV